MTTSRRPRLRRPGGLVNLYGGRSVGSASNLAWQSSVRADYTSPRTEESDHEPDIDVYDGRFNMTARRPISEENVER